MSFDHLEYPLRVCVELLHYCAWSNPKTEHFKASEIKQIVGLLFDDEIIDQAIEVLINPVN